MLALTEKILHYTVLVLVTIAAAGVMWKMSSKEHLTQRTKSKSIRELPPIVATKAPVEIVRLQVQQCDIMSTHSGKIRSWETYQIGFEQGGRVVSLGSNENDQPLDEGDRVVQGQVLAVLDDRTYRARKSEASAQVEQAASDLKRAQRVRNSNQAALSESELQSLVTDLAKARAQLDIAVKNVEDATLHSPVNATISRRLIKAGESVAANQIVFELVENDDVLLVLNVPESQIRELEIRKREVEQNLGGGDDPRAGDSVFQAFVNLEGRDRFGRPWPQLTGEVYHIAEVSDPRTGLFEVEVRLSNQEQLLRPGMVATADLVTARIRGYQVPESAVIFRNREAFLFCVDKEAAEMELLYWNLGPTDLYRARRLDLGQWIDQGSHIIVPEGPADIEAVVVRGHHRLSDSQWVRVVNLDEVAQGTTVEGENRTRRVDVAVGPEAQP